MVRVLDLFWCFGVGIGKDALGPMQIYMTSSGSSVILFSLGSNLLDDPSILRQTLGPHMNARSDCSSRRIVDVLFISLSFSLQKDAKFEISSIR